MPILRFSSHVLLAIAAAPLPLLAICMMFMGQDATAIGVAASLAIVWGLVFAKLAWRRLDEGAKEAHKFAYFWGGGAGLVLGAATVLVFTFFPAPAGDLVQRLIDAYSAAREPAPGAWRPGPVGFVLGVTAMVGLQLGLILLVWIGWWAKRKL